MNVDLKEFIPSEFYREFCAKNDITFTDRELASMVYNDFDMPLNAKLSKLEKIALATADGEFKQAIGDRIAKTRRTLDMVCSSESGRVFIADMDNAPYDNFEAAQKYCQAANPETGYEIKQYIVLSSCGDPSNLKHYVGGVRFNAKNKIMNVWDNGVEYPDKFTDSFVPFVNPFERGDIVRCCNSGKIGVVEDSQRGWSDHLKRAENNKAYDYMDSALIVQFLEENDLVFIHSHVQPIYLEKLQLNKNGVPKCFDVKSRLGEHLICYTSWLLKEECSLDVFTSVFLEWREELILKQVKSKSWRR